MTSMTYSADLEPNRTKTLSDPALALSLAWTEAHAAMAEQCLTQQRLETALLAQSSSPNVDGNLASRAGHRHGLRRAFAEAKAAEALASAREQELLECLARTPANSLAGVAAKLSVIVTEAEDNTDLTDFPVSHVRSALEDLRRLMDPTIDDACSVLKDGHEDASEPRICRTQSPRIQRER